MTTQFEAKEFLIFTFNFLTSAQQQNHSADFLTDVHETTQHKEFLNSGASRMAVNSNSAFYAATVEELLSRVWCPPVRCSSLFLYLSNDAMRMKLSDYLTG